MIVEPDFLSHWKTQMLVDLLEDSCAPLCVIALWAHCQQRRTDCFQNLSANALKAICRFSGAADKLRDALEEAGFIRRDGDSLVVHGWAERNAKLLSNWSNGPKGGRKSSQQETQGEPTDNPNTEKSEIGLTQTEPNDNPIRVWVPKSEPIRVDKRREEESGKEEHTHKPASDWPESEESVRKRAPSVVCEPDFIEFAVTEWNALSGSGGLDRDGRHVDKFWPHTKAFYSRSKSKKAEQTYRSNSGYQNGPKQFKATTQEEHQNNEF